MQCRTRSRFLFSGALFLAFIAGPLGGLAATAAEIPISGRVVGPGGIPLPEAEVTLLPLLDPVARASLEATGEVPAPAARARTDARGDFRLAAPAAGLWTVRVDSPGHVPRQTTLAPLLEARVLPDAELELDVGLSVKVVAPDGQPIPGARVWLNAEVSRRAFRRHGWSNLQRTGITAEDGTARLPRPEREDSTLGLLSSGLAYAERRGVRGTSARIELVAGRDRPVEVRTPDGRAVPGVLVRLGRNGHPIGFTDQNGRLAARVAGERDTELSLVAADGRRLDTTLRPLSDSAAAQRLVLPDRATLSGRLLDAETRRPIAGGLAWNSEEPWLAATTGGSGRFELSVPAEQTIYLQAGAPGYLPGVMAELSLAAGRPGPAIALQPAAAIEGLVVDDDGTPVPGAELTLEIQRSRGGGRIEIRIGAEQPLPVAHSDARGRFRLSPVDPEKSYEVRAAAEGFAPASESVRGLEPYETRSGMRLTVRQGAVLSGTIVDGEGRGIRDARLHLGPSRVPGGRMRFGIGGEPEGPSFDGSTDGDGRFTLANLPEGQFDLEVKRRGFARRRVPGLEIAEGGQPVDLGEIELQPGERLLGLVLDTHGQPVEGVEVSKTGDGPRMSFRPAGPARAAGGEPDALTDPDGWFVLDDLEPGAKVGLSLRRTGYIAETVEGIQLPQAEPLEVELVPASNVSGRVTDEEGEPIPGAKITLRRTQNMSMGGRVMMFMSQENATADGEGAFRFEEVSPGQISLSALATGWQEAKREDLEVARGEDLDGVEIPLPPGAIVEGRVLAPDGRAAIGALVDTVKEDGGPFRMGGAPVDGDGYYRLDGLQPGEVSVEATHPDYPRVVRDLEARAGVNRLNLSFTGGQQVSGRVTSSSGEPVAGAVVSLSAAGRMWGGPEASSGPDGGFSIQGVKDGDYDVRTAADGYARSDGEQQVKVAGEPVHGVEVVLVEGGSISGTVRGVEEREFSRVEIMARRVDGPGFVEGGVDYQGRYVLRNVPAGTWGLTGRVSRSGRQATGQIRLEPGAPEATLDLEFGRGLTLSGRAIQADLPIAEAMLYAEGTDVDHSGWTQTDREGVFSLDGLEAGTYRLDLRQWETGLSYRETVELSASREIVLEIPTARVAGRVVDATDRRPVSGVSLSLKPAEERGLMFFASYGATSDLDGRFAVSNVTNGAWRLTAEKKGYAATSKEIVIRSERELEDVTLALDPTEGLTFNVRLPSGEIPDEVQAAVLDPSGQSLVQGHYATGENGRVRLSSVPAGAWELLVSAVGSATANLAVQAPGQPIGVGLSPACSLRVRVPELEQTHLVGTLTVTDSGGRPFRALSWFGTPRSEWRLTNGVAELRGLPPGSWTVQVTTADGRTWHGTSTTSPGPTADLALQ